jgi:hypothetical protein
LQALSGYHRKSLLRRLNHRADQQQSSRRGQHRRRYGPEVVEALVSLWGASDRLCGKRLHALLPQLVESLEHHAHLQLEQAVRARVLTMSSATIDRLLAPVRQSSGDIWMETPSQGPQRRSPPRAGGKTPYAYAVYAEAEPCSYRPELTISGARTVQ